MKNDSLRRLTVSALFTAVAVILVFVNFTIIPQVAFLKYDFGDVVILILTFMFGPLYGIISTVIVSACQALFTSADGWFGALMHIVSTCALIIPSGIIYKYRRTRKGAAFGLLCGCICMVAAMLLFNFLLDPVFYGLPREAVVKLLPWIGVFNAVKSVANSVITLLVYKHISRIVNKE